MRFGDAMAVDRVTADIANGEFVTLLGPSGCGKTTLLNLVSGFLAPSEGQIAIGDKDVSRVPPEKRDTAMCFQSYALFPHLSVRENIAFGLRQKKTPADEIAIRVSKLSDQLGLNAHMEKLPNQLSGGQQQRVALGRALATRPSVILFDEPLSNLDAKLRESVRLEIRNIQAEARLTAVYVTHDQAEALAMSDRIFVMNEGKVEQVGTPQEIYHKPKTRFVADFIGAANILEAKVLGPEGEGHWCVETPIGKLIVASSDVPASERHYVSWRPENAQLVRDCSGENCCAGTVTASAFQGGYSDVFVRAGGPNSQRLHLTGETPGHGETIAFQISKDKLRILEPVT